MKTYRIWSLVLYALILLSLNPQALSQSNTEGAIAGTVLDPTGYPVAAATITIHNVLTNSSMTVNANAEGYFRATSLQPGQYTVSVTEPGFSTYIANNVVVQVGSITELRPTLRTGAQSESITVSGAAPAVNVESPALATNLDQVEISNLPINGRRWSDFVLLTPGVVRDPNGMGLTSFRGVSSLLNNITIDGADNNQALFSEERGRSLRVGYSTAQAAVQEFQVNTSNYSAEYGRAAGGVVNTVTRAAPIDSTVNSIFLIETTTGERRIRLPVLHR
ncbi:MAG: carboxypeptidase-like regulatory domain-containing protein [Acidobacteriaceae bacterium]